MRFKGLFKYILHPEGQSISMRKRLLLYMMLLFIIAVAFLMTGLIFSGVISFDDERLSESMSLSMDKEEYQLKGEIDAITVQGINMAQGIGRETEHILTENSKKIDDINNDLEMLKLLQNAYYGYMDTAVQISSASGVYVILDATANTKLENAKKSKSGVYLRVSNIDLKEKANRELNLYRGIAEIGREKGLRMNNQWKLEFDISRVSVQLHDVDKKINDVSSEYQYTSKFKLENMWEQVVLLTVPFTGTDGKLYGVCGLEISEALFSLWHPAFSSDYGPYVTVLAPYDGNMLYLENGLLGGTKDTFITDKENLKVTKLGALYKLESSYGEYVGVMRETDILGEYVNVTKAKEKSEEPKENKTDIKIGNDNQNNMKWMLVVLTPESSYSDYMRGIRLRWIFILLAVIVVCFAMSIFLSRRYVEPVLSGMEALKGEGGDNVENSGGIRYAEIDDLIQFMKSRGEDEVIIEEKLPENIAILFDRFAENIKKLSPAEWIVMDLYIKGHDISEIPELAFISMATVRKHNRNIYEKLEVSSRDELMLYIDLFRRADRIDELTQEKPVEEEKTDG